MIIYPSIDKLLDRVDSRYSLAVLAAKRAHQLENGDIELLNKYESPRTVGRALEEIADDKILIQFFLKKKLKRLKKRKKKKTNKPFLH